MAGLEGKVGEDKPNLEKIATDFANMQKDHKMDQIMPTVMDAFVNFKGVKYQKNGVDYYNTKFSAAQANGIADAVFDKLAYHAHLRRYKDMTPAFFEELKKMKDPNGNLLMEAEVQRALGITRQQLRQIIVKNRDNLTTDHFAGIVKDVMEHHVQYVAGQILSPINESHKDYVADFIKKKAKEKGLKGPEYEIKKTDTLKDLMPAYQNIAANFYKKND